jgi:hypothetical protein
MTKPQVFELRHEEMLSDAISRAKDKSVLSWWWLCIPIYLIAALLMKAFYMPHTTMLSNLHELTGRDKYSSVLFFLVLPFFFIILSFISIRKIWFLSGRPLAITFFLKVWFNIIIIIVSVLVIIIYSL